MTLFSLVTLTRSVIIFRNYCCKCYYLQNLQTMSWVHFARGYHEFWFSNLTTSYHPLPGSLFSSGLQICHHQHQWNSVCQQLINLSLLTGFPLCCDLLPSLHPTTFPSPASNCLLLLLLDRILRWLLLSVVSPPPLILLRPVPYSSTSYIYLYIAVLFAALLHRKQFCFILHVI